MFGIFGSSGAQDAAEREAELQWLATQEQVSRMEDQHEQIIGQAWTDVGASGFTSSSDSHQTVIRETEQEMARQRNMTLAMGEAGYNLAMDQADMLGASMFKQGVLGSLKLGSTGYGWFK